MFCVESRGHGRAAHQVGASVRAGELSGEGGGFVHEGRLCVVCRGAGVKVRLSHDQSAVSPALSVNVVQTYIAAPRAPERCQEGASRGVPSTLSKTQVPR